jgi:hypothetical protein
MIIRIALEWDIECGINVKQIDTFREGIENVFLLKDYGNSIDCISVVLTCLEKDLKQRKRFKREIGLFEYDIILDYYLIKNVELEQKKGVIKRQVIEISEQTFNKYKFEDFDKVAFLKDLKEIVHSIEW